MTTSTFSPLPVDTFVRCSVPELNLDRLRELAGQLRNAVRDIGGLGKESFLRDRREGAASERRQGARTKT